PHIPIPSLRGGHDRLLRPARRFARRRSAPSGARGNQIRRLWSLMAGGGPRRRGHFPEWPLHGYGRLAHLPAAGFTSPFDRQGGFRASSGPVRNHPRPEPPTAYPPRTPVTESLGLTGDSRYN